MLYLVNQPLSFPACVGLTGLMGMLVNNAILLVDQGNLSAKDNPTASTLEIAVESARNCFIPVLLTSITTIMGLHPLGVGNSMFKPLALVVIGGLFTSTFLTLFYLPSFHINWSPKKLHSGLKRRAPS